VLVPALNNGMPSVSMGGSTPNNGQSFAELADGTWMAWGNDSWSQLADGATQNEGTPEQVVVPPGVTYATIASGGATAYAIDTSGNVWTWGCGSKGQIGDGVKVSAQTQPAEVDSGAGLISGAPAGVVAGQGTGG
jgi:alpha-tubulin suppressor-like RCC1 family protein